MEEQIINNLKELYIKKEIAQKEAEKINEELQKLELDKEEKDFEFTRSGIDYEQRNINSQNELLNEMSIVNILINDAEKEKEQREEKIERIDKNILWGLGAGLAIVGFATIVPTTPYFPDLAYTPIFSALIAGGSAGISFVTSTIITDKLKKKSDMEYNKVIRGKNKLGKNLAKYKKQLSTQLVLNQPTIPVQDKITSITTKLKDKLEEIKELSFKIQEYEKKYGITVSKLTDEDYERINNKKNTKNKFEFNIEDEFDKIFAEVRDNFDEHSQKKR